MDYSKFQIAVIEIAGEGTRLTTANVVSRLRIDPQKAERMLDQMARDGRLDLEVDETEGVVVYRVRGLTPSPPSSSISARLEALRKSIDGPSSRDASPLIGTALAFGKPLARTSPLPRSLQRSIPLGVVLGALFPGIGLAYAAPWTAVAIATITVMIGFKVLTLLPFVGGLLAALFMVAAVVGSGVLGGVYAWRYNQLGRRSPLDAEEAPRRLPARSRG